MIHTRSNASAVQVLKALINLLQLLVSHNLDTFNLYKYEKFLTNKEEYLLTQKPNQTLINTNCQNVGHSNTQIQNHIFLIIVMTIQTNHGVRATFDVFMCFEYSCQIYDATCFLASIHASNVFNACHANVLTTK